MGPSPAGEKRGRWRYRVGDYRLICDIEDERITILVLETSAPEKHLSLTWPRALLLLQRENVVLTATRLCHPLSFK
jgi:hypothetical protein